MGRFENLEFERTAVIGAPSATRFSRPVRRNVDDPLKILIPNGLSRLKGGDTLCELVRSTRGLAIEYHFFGKSDRGYSDDEIRSWNPRVHFHGPYSRSDLEAFAPGAHVSIHASIWPETFCISLSEMWDLGLVPIGSRIGALGERIRNGENGFTVPPGDSLALKNTLIGILENRNELERIRSTLGPDLSTSAGDCSKKMQSLYQNLLGCTRTPRQPVRLPASHASSWSTGKGPKSRRIRKWLQVLGSAWADLI